MAEIDHFAAEDQVVLPWSKEVIALADTQSVARAWREADNLARQVYKMRDNLRDVILSHMDQNAKYTMNFGSGLTVRGDRPGDETEFDVTVLVELLDADPALPQERYDDLVKTKVEYTVYKRVADDISAANAVWAEIIERSKTLKTKRRYLRTA